jgi:hypothetical protein
MLRTRKKEENSCCCDEFYDLDDSLCWLPSDCYLTHYLLG